MLTYNFQKAKQAIMQHFGWIYLMLVFKAIPISKALMIFYGFVCSTYKILHTDHPLTSIKWLYVKPYFKHDGMIIVPGTLWFEMFNEENCTSRLKDIG